MLKEKAINISKLFQTSSSIYLFLNILELILNIKKSLNITLSNPVILYCCLELKLLLKCRLANAVHFVPPSTIICNNI